ncbi:MAG TPA: alpha/beta fold hydrolase [Thermoguttaceae bacterium]|nr:alpha/beta fold hydrolase [Thermoguttaceae bacterium]
MNIHALFRFHPAIGTLAQRGGNHRCWQWAFRRVVSSMIVLLASGVFLYAEQAKETPKIPPPKDIDLDTRDGVLLKATYYASTLGKEAAVVLMLHDSDGNRNELAPLALVLQSAGYAVLTLDLRGHGESVSLKGSNRQLSASQLTNRDFQAMVTEDVERAKRFLLERNNQGELNIEKLCVLGVGMGAVVAMEWAFVDWSWPQLLTHKQGRDVKALILISPEFTFRNLSTANFFKHPEASRRISGLIIVGDGKPKSLQDAKRIHGMFERSRPKTVERPEQRDLFFIPLKTNLQGGRLVDEKNLRAFKIDQIVLNFLKIRLAEQSYPWTDRRSPLEK